MKGVETRTLPRLAGAFEAMVEEVSSSEVDGHEVGAQKGVDEPRGDFLVGRNIFVFFFFFFFVNLGNKYRCINYNDTDKIILFGRWIGWLSGWT